jgi:cytochrome c-type biogenesis protein CcmH/NrfG
MNMKSFLVSAAVCAAVLPAVTLAQPVDNSPKAIQIVSLEAGTRIAPSDGGAYAELGAAYWRAGRTADAVAAYRRVLALDNVMLETRTGDAVWSHAVARAMLARGLQTSDARN